MAPLHRCQLCNTTFASWDAFHSHKVFSSKHITCVVCSIDFKTTGGAKRHQVQAHAAEQNLPCPGCRKVFTRVGGLMSHIEQSECPAINAEGNYHKRRARVEANTGQFDKIRAAHEWGAGKVDIGHIPKDSEPDLTWLTTSANVEKEEAPTIDNSGQRQDAVQRHPTAPMTNIKRQVSSAKPADPNVFQTLIARKAESSINRIQAAQPSGSIILNSPQAHIAQSASLPGQNSRDPSAQASQVSTTPSIPVSDDDDLISFSAALNAPWGEPVTDPATTRIAPSPRGLDQFPALTSFPGNRSQIGRKAPNIMDEPLQYDQKVLPTAAPKVKPVTSSAPSWDFPKKQSTPEAVASNLVVQPKHPILPTIPLTGSAWSTQKNLFPDAPPAVAPPTELLEKLQVSQVTKPADPASSDHALFDPTSPSFNPSTYFVVFSRKYKCPHKGCPKSFPSQSGFIQHLKSPAHVADNQKLKCPKCYRYFASATALTQHAESQGVRCMLRETDQYGEYILEITASTATTAGRHDDNTIKYATMIGNSNLTPAQRVAEANEAVLRKVELAKANYWDTRKGKEKW